MPLRETAPIGAPCWVDLFTSDPDRSRAFYTELFGWKAEEPNAEFGGYWNFVKDDVLVAGGMRNDGSSGQPDSWSVYLASADAQATIDAATAHGGQVDRPRDAGRRARHHGGGHRRRRRGDRHLATRYCTRASASTTSRTRPAWFELHTRDYDASVAFYRDVFAWDTHTVSDAPEFRYTTLGEGDGQLAGIMDARRVPPGRRTARRWSVYFRVDDTDAALTQDRGARRHRDRTRGGHSVRTPGRRRSTPPVRASSSSPAD